MDLESLRGSSESAEEQEVPFSRKGWGKITNQHFPFEPLFVLQREVLRRCTHLSQVRKERGRLILLVFRLPVGFNLSFNSRRCFRKFWNSRGVSGWVPACSKGCVTPALGASSNFLSSTAGIRSRDHPLVLFVGFLWGCGFPPLLNIIYF